MDGLNKQEIEYRQNNGMVNNENIKNSRTVKQIIINDVNVPKLHNSADTFKSINNAHIITTKPDKAVTICGVLNFLCISFKDFGKKLSLLIANKILAVPS